MAYAVATRRREFGIRMAFGAMRQDLIRQVLRGGLTLTTVGLLVGLAGAVGVAQLLASELYQVKGSDPLRHLREGTAANRVRIQRVAELLRAPAPRACGQSRCSTRWAAL
jgi:ABC-type antimicrobial peptide transport system permease subunit